MNLHHHIARKRFGQHFLTDPAVIDAIVALIDPQAGQTLVEIGPGLAALTQPLVERLGQMTVIELDRDLAGRLRQHRQLCVLEADVLKVDFAQFVKPPKQLRVVGNLPYNISTPILFHLLALAGQVQDQHFMLQSELVDRMVALPDCAAYGRLSVMLQWRYVMTKLLTVSAQSFSPPPRVQSAVVRMLPRAFVNALDLNILRELVQVAFSQRRKLLRHSLGVWLEKHNFPGHFDVQRRAQEVTVADYVSLAQTLSSGAANWLSSNRG